MENELVSIKGNQAVTTSLQVAQYYERKHKNVLESIRKTMQTMSADRAAHLYEEGTYTDAQGKTRPMIYMNRDGYTLLVMGFEGKKAADFRLAYMDAFNKMEAYIKEQVSNLPAPKTSLQVLQATINQMVEIEAKQLEMQNKVSMIEQKVVKMEEERILNGQALLQAELSTEDIPSLTMRAKINQLARQYGTATNTPMADVWHKVYGDLYYLYHIQLQGKNKLEEAERRGVLEPIYNIVSSLIRKVKSL